MQENPELKDSVQPPSVDRVRLIRRGMRCFVFGAIGLIPILGSGLAIQALRLRADVKAELGERPDLPPVYVYWLGGLILLWALDGRWGISGDSALCVVLLAAQTGHIWRRTRFSAALWNPADRQMRLAAILACAGLALSLWLLGVLGRRFAEMNAAQ